MLYCNDCFDQMKLFENDFIDAVVTDPPYGLSFMGKAWDYDLPSIDIWKEALRISKPGAHMLCFGGTRTFHRLACRIEDAGWQIRDCMMWLYGSGFPKSHNFGKELGGEWSGYGTALKPAWEPILVCMKPCEGTFAENAEKHSVAGLNIDESRIGTHQTITCIKDLSQAHGNNFGNPEIKYPKIGEKLNPPGRWPANIILDEEAGEMLDEQSGISKSSSKPLYSSLTALGQNSGWNDHNNKKVESIGHGDSGGASRFFYCAKTSPGERGKENNHPTVKPLKLMEYLIKLIMPPKDSVLLDPFAGSGSTLVAAKKLGVKFIGIEKSKEYCEIASKRLEKVDDSNLFF